MFKCCVLVKPSHLFGQAGSTAGINNETANSMMQNFWDAAMALSPNEDGDETTRRFLLNFLKII